MKEFQKTKTRKENSCTTLRILISGTNTEIERLRTKIKNTRKLLQAELKFRYVMERKLREC